MSRTILGIDPGSRHTGVVVRTGETLLSWTLEVRKGRARMPDGVYLRQVLGGCSRVLRDAGLDPRARDTYVVGVEGLAYWPERDGRRRDQRGLYGTAMVLGAVLARWSDATVVDSGRGVAKLHPQSYPEPIRAPGVGEDRLGHVRAAWDHSHAAETLYLRRVREARPT